MKIVVVSVIRDVWGGSEDLWYQMAKKALGKKDEVIHLSYDIGKPHHFKLEELIGLGLQEFKRPTYVGKAGIGLFERVAKKTLNYFSKKIDSSFHRIFGQKPDVIVYNATAHSVAHESILLKHLHKHPTKFVIVCELMNPLEKTTTKAQLEKLRYAYKRASKIYFISGKHIPIMEKELGVSLPNAELIRNPVNLIDASLVHYPEGKPSFASVGNLNFAHKGQDILLQVLADEKWKNRDWHLNIYGYGPDEEKLKSLINHHQLHHKITLRGTEKDVRKIWAQNHILLMPSRMEGLPLVLVESMLCGRTCVINDVGDIGEWVVDDSIGYLSATTTPESFAQVLDKAWDERSQWEQKGLNARAFALQHYDPDAGGTLLKKLEELHAGEN